MIIIFVLREPSTVDKISPGSKTRPVNPNPKTSTSSELIELAAHETSAMKCVIALSLAATGAAFATTRSTLAAPRRTASTQLQMMDAAMIQGGAAAVSGLAVGIFMAKFSEDRTDDADQRASDAVSDATRAKMSAMFVEDEVAPDTGLDDTVRRMEAAMAAAKGKSADAGAAPEPAEESKPTSSIDDGW